MKTLLAIAMALGLAGCTSIHAPENETGPRQAVQSFYDAFNSHDFEHSAEFTADDWNHINPSGGWTRGREAVLAELEAVHSTFLRGVSDTPESMTVRFAARDVAVITVPSRMSPFVTPDGTRHENERQVRTFIVVRRQNRWMIMQDQNTVRVQ